MLTRIFARFDHDALPVRLIRLIHRDFRNEIIGAFDLGDMAINFASLLDRGKRFVSYCCDLLFADIKSFVNSVNRKRTGIFFVFLDEGLNIRLFGLFADVVVHIKSKKIAEFDEFIYIIQSDMVGVHEIRPLPFIGGYRIVGFFACVCVACAYYLMFSMTLLCKAIYMLNPFIMVRYCYRYCYTLKQYICIR